MTPDRKRIGCEHERTEIEMLSNRDGQPDFELEGTCKLCGAELYAVIDAAEMDEVHR
jgi:hypothetical protein